MNERLQSIADDFQFVEEAERVAHLAEYGRRLPPLPPELERAVQAGIGRVHECETPVFVFPAVREGAVHVYAYAPPESATPRAFAGLLLDVLEGGTPADVAALPDAPELVRLLGLERKIIARRQVGLQGLIDRIKHGVAEVARGA